MTKLSKYFCACFYDPDFPQRELASAIMRGERSETILQEQVEHVKDIDEVLPGLTPLELGINKRNSTVVKLLLENGADTERSTIAKWSPLLRACSDGYLQIVKHLVEFAAKNKQIQVVSYLLEQDFCLTDGIDEDGYTVLHHVVLWNDSALTSKLISKKVAIDSQNQKGETPVFLATKHNHPESLHVLLNSGANPNIKTKNGETALFEAVTQGRAEIVTLLLSHGADSTAFSTCGQSPVDLTMEAWIAQKQKNTSQPGIVLIAATEDESSPQDAFNTVDEPATNFKSLFKSILSG